MGMLWLLGYGGEGEVGVWKAMKVGSGGTMKVCLCVSLDCDFQTY